MAADGDQVCMAVRGSRGRGLDKPQPMRRRNAVQAQGMNCHQGEVQHVTGRRLLEPEPVLL